MPASEQKLTCGGEGQKNCELLEQGLRFRGRHSSAENGGGLLMDERSNRGALSDRSLRMTCPRSRSVPTPPQGSLSGRAIPLRSRPRSWMTPRRVVHTLTAPAEVRSPAWTAEPAVTPTATMLAALAAIISQRESPTYQQ